MSWTLPTENTDGSPLTDLVGINIYYGCTQPGAYAVVVNLGVVTTHEIVAVLPDTGTCYFAASAVNSRGIESALSNEVFKLMGAQIPEPPTNLIADSSDLTVYGIIQSLDRVVLLPVGVVASDTACDGSQTVNGRYLVPKSAVTFAGSVQPEANFASCVEQ